MSSSAGSRGLNMGEWTALDRDAVSAHRAICLERFNRAREIADRIYAEKHRNGWRAWAEREIAKHAELDAEIRRVLNWRMKGKRRD